MNGRIIAMEPYAKCESTYIGMISAMLETEYHVVDYGDAKNNVFPLDAIDTIYLNWIENKLDEKDRAYLREAKQSQVKVVWVFHNRVPHDTNNAQRDIERIKFLVEIADKVCVLSHKSIDYLKEYAPDMDENKIEFLPHQDFIGMYGHLGLSKVASRVEDADLVFACLGLIRPYKNIEIVIQSFNNFNRGKKCKLLIAGRPIDYEYVGQLEKLIQDDSVIIIPQYIPSSMMGTYLEYSDVLVLPYNMASAMNSGAMVMAFSYLRTVIVSDIAMADEFDQKNIYKYTFNNESNHIEQLQIQMDRVYKEGRNCVRGKGEELFYALQKSNSKELVKEKLLSVVRNERKKIIKSNVSNSSILYIVNDRDSWKERYKVSQMEDRMIKLGTSISQMILDSSIRQVAIYGYGIYGRQITKELEQSGIDVLYIIDKRAHEIRSNIKLYTIEDDLPKVQALIVTVPGLNYYELYSKMNRKGSCEIYILKEIF